MPVIKVKIVYTLLSGRIYLNIYFLKQSHHIAIFWSFTQMLVSEIYLIIYNISVFQNYNAGQMKKKNELHRSYAQEDLFYIIYRNLGINVYVCTQGYSVSFPFFTFIYKFVFCFAKSKIATPNCQVKYRVSSNICFVSLSDWQWMLEPILSYPKHWFVFRKYMSHLRLLDLGHSSSLLNRCV